MSQEIPFDPFPFLQDPHQQTIVNSFLHLFFEPGSISKRVRLPDGDTLSLEVTTPPEWTPENPTVLLVHGLCGSHKSPNVVRMAKRLHELQIRSVRFNMRGCGSGKGLAKHIYHSGRSEDIFFAIQALLQEHPLSSITLVGFSLGANIVLKLAGELNSLGPHFLDRVIAVSPPVDLYSSTQMLGNEENRLFEKYFYKILRADVLYLHRKFKLPPVHLPRDLKLYEFDQLYTAPACGFHSARDYYDKCSAQHYVSDIDVSTKILLSEDDPIISASALDHIDLPPHIHLFKTKHGGHLGYLGHPKGEKGIWWLDSLLLEWIQNR
jgi:hypothetical protein